MLLALIPALALAPAFHTPHDAVYSVAAVPTASGPAELYAVFGDQTLRVSRDDGETWEILPGSPLNGRRAIELAWHPGAPAAGGSGLVLVTTEDGPWSLDPVTGDAAPLDAGIAAGDRYGIDIAVPVAGSGPALMLTQSGAAYLLAPSTMTWSKVFQAGPALLDRGDVALSPYFDETAANPAAHDLFVALNGQLWRSVDGGLNWHNCPAFSAPAVTPTQWMITSMALSDDYANDRTVVVGRTRLRAPGSILDEGQILRSTDRGQSAVLAHTLLTGVFALAATPPGPGGTRSFLAAGRAYPGYGDYVGTGILRSQDGGASWDDNGSHQDFLLEDGPGNASGERRMSQECALLALPDYGTRGEVAYARLEGLFRSRDEGVHWRQDAMFGTDRCRDLRAVRAPGGGLHVLTANYGAGSLLHDLAAGTTEPMEGRAPVGFVTGIAASPSYADDGRALVAGSIELASWQSAAVGATGTTPGWSEPPLADPVTGLDLQAYPWQVRFSPSYDRLGRPGTDLTYFWITREGAILRTEDDGQTAEALDHMVSGNGAPFFVSFAPTPDYGPGTGSVVAGTEAGKTARLTPFGWRNIAPVGDPEYPVDAVLAPSDWDPASNPRFYALKKEPPFVFEVVDGGGPATTVTPVGQGLPVDIPTGIAAHPDFANRPLLFVSLAAGGVWARDFSQPGSAWEPVGAGFPPYRCESVAVSPDFEQDGLLLAGTAYGLWTADLSDNGVWTRRTTATLIDEKAEQFTTYAPLHPSNPYPDHVWPWAQVWRSQFPAQQQMLDKRVLVADSDQSEARMPLRASAVEVLSYRGQNVGSMVVTAHDPVTGAVLATVQEDLQAAVFPPQIHAVRLDLPGGTTLFDLVIRAELDSGESLAVDGLKVEY